MAFNTGSSLNRVWAQLKFPSKTQFLAICLNFQQQNSLKNQCLSHLSSENYEINSIESEPTEDFPPTTPRMLPNSNAVLSFNFI